MMKAIRSVLLLALVLAIASPLIAAEQPHHRGGRRPHHGPREGFSILSKHFLEGINLTADQKAKVEELKAQVGPKLKEAREKMHGIFTEEQKQARAEAVKAAREAGKKGHELREAVKAAVQLTDEQKAKLAEVRKAMGEVHKEIREQFKALLTPEQKEAIKERIKERMKKAHGHHKKRAEKKAEAEK